MKVHTTAFKEQIKEMGRELDSIITYGETVLGSEELNAVTPSFQGGILKSVMKQLDIDSNVPIPVGTILNYQFGVKVNGEYEYLNFGNYVVKDMEKQEDTMSYKMTCYDKLLFSMKDYVKMPITYPITIRSYINALCSFSGIRFANNNDTFVNYNKIIPNELYLDTNGNSIGYTFRDVLDELAQVTASTICLNDNDELEIRYINDTGDTIDEEFLKNVNVNFGERYGKVNSIVLSRSGESDNIYLRDETSVAENGICELKIIDNQIMNFNNRDEFLPEILGKLNGLEYYLNDFSSTGITYYDVCDRYNVKIGDNTYSCVMFNDEILITQGLEENVFTEMPQETETDYTKADKTDRKINQTYFIVDKQNQQIQSVIDKTDEQNDKIAEIKLTVDELNSKISDIADITTSAEDTDAKIELNEINQSEPIRLVVRPIGESISNLLISSDMLISDNLKLKQRVIRFTNTNTNEIFDYPLPNDLWYYDSENYDEFILDYDGQSCVINKKVGLNQDGTTYILENPTTIEYDYPNGDNAIVLTEGNYTVEILGYDTAYIFARLMAKNIYTTQFYTKAEVDSEISQTAQDIELSVNGKFENYSTTTEMNSAISLKANEITNSVSNTYATKNELTTKENTINQRITNEVNEINLEVSNKANTSDVNNALSQKANTTDVNASLELKIDKDDNNQVVSMINASADVINLKGNRVTIDSDNFELTADGKITATAGDIGGFDLSETNFASAVSGIYNYTIYDLRTIQAFLLNYIHSSNILKYTLDENEDGTPNTLDMVGIQRILLGDDTSSRTVNAQFNINAQDPKNCLSITCNGETAVSLGASGINADIVATKSLICSKDDDIYSAMTGVLINGETAEIRLIEELNEGDYTILAPSGITTPILTQTSKESVKKNFEKFKGGIEIIKDADVYSYNLKIEEDTDKKHIGLVINDLGGDYKTPEEVIDKSNEGIDLYSMVSISWQAIKEQQMIIEELKKEIEELKNEKENN